MDGWMGGLATNCSLILDHRSRSWGEGQHFLFGFGYGVTRKRRGGEGRGGAGVGTVQLSTRKAVPHNWLVSSKRPRIQMAGSHFDFNSNSNLTPSRDHLVVVVVVAQTRNRTARRDRKTRRAADRRDG